MNCKPIEFRRWKTTYDYLSGSDSLRKMVEEGETAEGIKTLWKDDIDAFKL